MVSKFNSDTLIHNHRTKTYFTYTRTLFLSYLISLHPDFRGGVNGADEPKMSSVWYALGYLQYITIESYGSIAVATFWSFANSTLTLKAAKMMDEVGNKVAKNEIAMIKVAAPIMALKIIDDAIQAYGGAGVTTDPRLAQAYAGMRTLRLADGPDEVHRLTIARNELKKYL